MIPHLSRPEAVVCTALIVVVLLAWVGFAIEHYQALQARAFVGFVRQHLSLGESPSFILNTALTVSVLPTQLLRSGRFLVGSAIAILMMASLGWLALRIRRTGSL